jgi:cell division protein FtsL
MAGTGTEAARGGRRAVPDLANLAVRPELGGRRGIGVGAFVLALVTAGAMAHVAVRMKGIEVAYDLGREKRVNTQLEEERRRLNIEIGMLKDPVRIVSLARDKLKMGPPAPADIVRLTPGQVLGARAEAPAAPPGKAQAGKPRGAAAASAKPAGAARAKAQAPAKAAAETERTAPSDEPTADSPSERAPAQEADE